MNPSPSTTTQRPQANAPGRVDLAFELYDREWYSLKLAAHVCGMSESYIEKKFDEGRELSGHVHNAGHGRRETKRIPRAWLVAYMLATARYDLDALVDCLARCFGRLSLPLLNRIRAAVDDEIRRRSGASAPQAEKPAAARLQQPLSARNTNPRLKKGYP